MIIVDNICVQFSGIDLFQGITFVINPKDRIGLVGKNGVGKSTLMHIISGEQKPETGTISHGEGVTIGYLPQEIKNDSTKSIYDEVLTVFQEIINIEKDIERINVELTTRTDYESDSYNDLLVRLSEHHEKLSFMDGHKIEKEAERVLKGLGFKASDFSRSLAEFSGGWQMRVELAKLLIQQPSLLLLDEPTNHLDIESILWLEEFLINYPGAVMMVSHDRMFLDNITNRTIEIVFGKTHDYKASYTKYFELREERLEQQRSAYKNQQKYIAQQERFIERFKAKNTKAKQAQSKMKQLDKIERIEFDELDTDSIQFKFPPAPRSGDFVLHAEDVRKAYGESVILNKLEFDIERGDRVAFVGKNGEGKSTLVKLVVGQEKFEAILKLGHNVTIGYYAQIQESTLNENDTVLETIENIASNEWSNISRIRGLLGAFLFGPDDVDKRVKVLSGGEKSRLALAKLLLKPINLLILDEPTNHLDIASKEVLKNALLDYNGTLIVVSHDRDFLQGLTTKTFEFKNKGIKVHYGPIDEFLESHKAESFRDFEIPVVKSKDEKEVVTPVSSNKENFERKKELEKNIKTLQSSIKRYEQKIEEQEKIIKSFEEKMTDVEFYNSPNSKEIIFKHAEAQRSLDDLVKQWERTIEDYEREENVLKEIV